MSLADRLWDEQVAAEAALADAQHLDHNYPGDQSDLAVRRAQQALDTIIRKRRWALAHAGLHRGEG